MASASETDQHGDVAAPGLDRRALIRRAALAGAAAWTAPMVIDSLTSPAAAGTYTGCFRAQFDRTGNSCATFTRVTPDNGAGCLEPSNWNNLPDYPGTLTLSGAGTAPNCSYTLTIESGNCSIDARSVARRDQGNQCATGTAGPGCQSITYVTTFLPDRFKILVSCDGVICAGGAAC
jgi:hypothetical protein